MPRVEPVGAPGTPAPELLKPVPATPLAPRAPVYPTATREEGRRFAAARSGDDRFLGMPRVVAYWVVGGIAALLLVIIIALLASRPSGQTQNQDNNAPAPTEPK